MPDVILAGLSISKMQCIVTNNGMDMNDFVLFNPEGSKTHVNGKPVPKNQKVTLKADDRIIFGSSNVFRLYVPGGSSSIVEGKAAEKSDDKNNTNETISWHYAMEELNQAQLAAFGEQHREEREASEKFRQQLENKLKEMELQIKHERASGGARAAELEEKLSKERSRADRMQKRKGKKNYVLGGINSDSDLMPYDMSTDLIFFSNLQTKKQKCGR